MVSMFSEMFGCCRRPWGAIPLFNEDEDNLYYHQQTKSKSNAVHLDIATAGQYAVVLKNNTRLCGSGGVRANVPIWQDKAYFEIKVQTTGTWAAGLCSSKVRGFVILPSYLLS